MAVRREEKMNPVIDEWLKISLFHPELIIDPWGAELDALPATFRQHRHDQSILTPLVAHYREHTDICVLPETAESRPTDAAIAADRWRLGYMTNIQYLKYKIYTMIHGE